MKLLSRIRRVYFFGYGADSEPDMIQAITGHKPRVVGVALLADYELRVQHLSEITTKGANPQAILRKGWGGSFKSYVIVPSPGHVVKGTLFKVSLHDRHLIDNWEFVGQGWYDKAFVAVQLNDSGKVYSAETQVLAPGQDAAQPASGLDYESWLQPKSQFVSIARNI